MTPNNETVPFAVNQQEVNLLLQATHTLLTDKMTDFEGGNFRTIMSGASELYQIASLGARIEGLQRTLENANAKMEAHQSVAVEE